ncbi:MAG: hypothetical protein OXI63_11620 [Candidatus Poribacteria bacterium]|nr:hypothetical protein [Candidatus Poribacteria bacterium]
MKRSKPKPRYTNNPLAKPQSRQRELADKQTKLIKRAREARRESRKPRGVKS